VGDRANRPAVQEIADQAFSRAAGAPLITDNRVELLKDAAENYPAWLKAIRNAQRYIHFESYIIHEDDQGWKFAEALIDKAKAGVKVRLIYDWLGGFGKASRSFWRTLRASGVEVRCYNPPHWDSPLGWLSRDHRKTLTVDGRIAFITGLCVGRMWVGVPEKGIEPWRDTGVAIEGPAVADVEHAFAYVWAMMGERLPEDEIAKRDSIQTAGEMNLRIVDTLPATAGMMRSDQLVAALARNRLWLTDAYYAGTTSYVQALRAAAQDGVDVRLLLPNGTDIPVLRPLSRSGYRPLLEAGVRIFEWNGRMLHAKTAVADGRWARVGSTNLNIASWFGNCEIDAVVEDEKFAREMEQAYLDDLKNATEVVLDARQRVRRSNESRGSHRFATSGAGSGGRVAAGALRIGNAVGAAFGGKRVLEPVEARLMLIGGASLLGLAIMFAYFPRLLVFPIVVLFLWFGIALVYRSFKLYWMKDQQDLKQPDTPPSTQDEPESSATSIGPG
jgi:cardiolipin synthase A/B